MQNNGSTNPNRQPPKNSGGIGNNTYTPGIDLSGLINPLNLVNSINTLINTDAAYIQAWLKETGPLLIISIILIAVMLIAAREFIKE